MYCSRNLGSKSNCCSALVGACALPIVLSFEFIEYAGLYTNESWRTITKPQQAEWVKECLQLGVLGRFPQNSRPACLPLLALRQRGHFGRARPDHSPWPASILMAARVGQQGHGKRLDAGRFKTCRDTLKFYHEPTQFPLNTTTVLTSI